MFNKVFKVFDENDFLDVRDISYKNKNYKVFVDIKNKGKLIITDDNCNLVKDKDILQSLFDIVSAKNSCANS